MTTSSNGNIFRVTCLLWGESIGRPVTRSFDVFFDLHLNERFSKQSKDRWFETPSRSLWRHCNDHIIFHKGHGNQKPSARDDVSLSYLLFHAMEANNFPVFFSYLQLYHTGLLWYQQCMGLQMLWWNLNETVFCRHIAISQYCNIYSAWDCTLMKVIMESTWFVSILQYPTFSDFMKCLRLYTKGNWKTLFAIKGWY